MAYTSRVWDGTQWVDISNSLPKIATGGGTDSVFFENGQTVTTSYSISTGKNAITAGPINIQNGATVTIPSGSTWVVV